MKCVLSLILGAAALVLTAAEAGSGSEACASLSFLISALI